MNNIVDVEFNNPKYSCRIMKQIILQYRSSLQKLFSPLVHQPRHGVSDLRQHNHEPSPSRYKNNIYGGIIMYLANMMNDPM
jgi:hypothetical protein